MVSFSPNSGASNAVTAANVAAAAAIASSTLYAVPSSTSLSAEKVNNIRLMSVYELLSGYLNNSSRFEASDVKFLCYSLARAIDYAIILNSLPGIAPRLPSLIKLVYDWRKNAVLLPAVMVVLLSIKNACRRGWFQPTDSKELLIMVDEICNNFCTEVCPNNLVGHAFETISKIIPKFYPHLKLCSLIVSFEAKPGYDVLMSDFHIPKNQLPGQKIELLVVNMQNLETSSCIAGPAQVSFLVNGKGVNKRHNASLECGPQLPTDISKMCKYGINFLQALGYFDGTYLIAVVYMSRMSNITPVLKDYIQPVVAALDSDSEIIEGPSRISLNCPISLKRIKTPVKGYLCKHRQCFDYDNFIELNSMKPNWRCPHCNQPVCFTDLRIDQNMVKIVEEVGDAAEVIIHSNGSWVVFGEHEKYANQLPDGTLGRAVNIESETNFARNSMAEPVDLTMEEDDNIRDVTQKHGQEVSFNGSASQIYNNSLDAEDRKPLVDAGDFRVPHLLVNPQLSSHTSDATQSSSFPVGCSMQATFMSSYSATAQGGASQSVQTNNVIAPVLNETPITVHAFPIMNNLSERITGRSVTRHVDRTPVISPRSLTNLLDSGPLATNNSTMSHQTAHTSMATLHSFSEGMGVMDMYQVTRSPETSAMQDLSHHNPYVSFDGQETVCLPSPNSTHGQPLLSHRTRPADLHGHLRTPPGFRTLHPISQAPNLLPKNVVGPALSNFTTNLLNQTNANRSAPTWRLQPSRENSRVVTADSWRSLTGSVPSPLVRPGGPPELPTGSTWRPIRRMRGSLMGSEYSAVLNHYMAPSSQSTTTRAPLISPAPSLSDQVSALVANNRLSQRSGDN
ncbi:hypothetical protein HPP92_002895 [Vanilla planifolia]|uniref:SP-RING-type domain-containing protein n=1 Tax=Vanilla planifolia TaxID=51239 RepID=A0A835VEX9_VANPL|nr:hypothetical protein HPP92_002895 [Vanilla planifolia]